MTVTTQTYTAAPTWTPSALAGAFRSAFIDAGLMTEWHDSFLSGSVENRVLEITYDGSKTYGKTYYWFMFMADGVYLHLAGGWNTGTNVPSGTQYLDFFATTTNSTVNHCKIVNLSPSTEFSIRCYSSGVTSGFCWFNLRNGNTYQNLHIVRGNALRAAWIDLDVELFHWWGRARLTVNGSMFSALAHFLPFSPVLRRSFAPLGLMISNSTNASIFGAGNAPQAGDSPLGTYGVGGLTYMYPGSAIGAQQFSQYRNSLNLVTENNAVNFIPLPVRRNAVNPADTDSNPIVTGMQIAATLNEGMPADFGLGVSYADRTMQPRDKFIVSSGVEEWEIIDRVNAVQAADVSASLLLLARVV